MKTDLTTTGSFTQSKARLAPAKDATLNGKPLPADLKGKIAKSTVSPDYKVELNSRSNLPEASVPTPDTKAPSLPDAPSLKPKIEEAVKGKVREEATAEIVKIKDVKVGSVKNPAIIFIKGLDIFSSPSKSEGGYAGVGRMAESVEGARIYGWNQKDEIVKEVMKIHPDYPVILVGHSLGGDTALEVAEELDSLENKFRTVDLLITLDAVGADNDIIPQNVKSHMNVFGENDFFFNDGPHVARRNEKTTVINILSPDDHTDIDDNKEIQFEVVGLIQKTLGGISVKKT